MRLKIPRVSDIRGRRVLVRIEGNVPLKPVGHGWTVSDDRRLRANVGTIQWLLEHQAHVVLISHLGRPNGHHSPELSLKPVADRLSELLSTPVELISDYNHPPTVNKSEDNLPKTVILLENLRFHPGEQANQADFARSLATWGEVYINDAFASCHRAHASVAKITEYLPSFAGQSVVHEVEELSQVRETPHQPLVVIVGGAKISDKLAAIKNLAGQAELVLTGGGVANVFLKADGWPTRRSYIQDAPADLQKKGHNFVHVAADLLEETKHEVTWGNGHFPLPKILYPLDVVVADSPAAPRGKVIDLTQPPASSDPNWKYLDIGPKTIALYQEIISQAKTIFWNGPLGVFEQPAFAQGTRAIAAAIAKSPGRSIVGGGDTLAAVTQFGLAQQFDYLSTGGGASLAFLAGQALPGLTPLVSQS